MLMKFQNSPEGLISSSLYNTDTDNKGLWKCLEKEGTKPGSAKLRVCIPGSS